MSSTRGSESDSGGPSSHQLAYQDATEPEHLQRNSEVQRSSTPLLGHDTDLFRVSTSDISAISASISQIGMGDKRPVRRRLLESENLQEVPQGDFSASTPYRPASGGQSRRSDSSTKGNQNRLYEILAERFSGASLNGPVRPSVSRSSFTSERSLLDNTSSSSVDNEPPAKRIKRVQKGKDWDLFKPLHDDTIYYHVINEPDEIDGIADKWVHLYTRDSRQAVNDLLQFFVDVCGYQEFDISTQFRFDDPNFMEIIDWMEKNPTGVQKYFGKYLLSCCSDWSRQSQNSIFEFIVQLLEVCNHGKILFDLVMLRYVLEFLKESTASISKAIRHTSIAIAAKIYTVFTKIQVREQMTPSQHSKHRAAWLSKLIVLLQGQIEEFGFFDDPAVGKMKIICIEEMWQWFRMNPTLISTTKYFHRLKYCVQNHCPKVQLAALETCYKMIETDVLSDDMAPVMEAFLHVVEDRFLDVDYKVAIASVKVLKRMLYTYPNLISQATKANIMLRVYHTHVPLAMAAGEFATAVFQKDSNETTSESTIIGAIIQFSILCKEKSRIPLLVESLLHCCVALTNWNLIINMLLNESFANNKDKVLVEIMCNAAEQTLTGKSKIPRPNTPKRKISNRNVKLVSDAFLSNLHHLLPKYSSDPTSMHLLVELLLYVDFEATSASKYKTEMDGVIYFLRPTFMRSTDTQLLDTISKIFARLCEESCPFRRASSVETLKGAVVEIIQKFPISQTKLVQKDILEAEARFLQLSILFRYLDMTGLITYENLSTWLNVEHSVTSKAKKHIITCCSWYLIWNVRTIIDMASEGVPEEDLKQEIDSLKRNRTEFISTCFDFLEEWQNVAIRNEAFDCICKLHLQFQNDLKNAIKSNQRFDQMLKGLMPVTLEQDLQILLISSAQKMIFEDETESTVPSRRNYLCSVINLVVLNVIDIAELFKLFKYYHSHNKVYGDIFDDYLKKFRAELGSMGIASFVLHTLLHYFENLPEEIDRNAISMHNTNIKKLMALAAQFQLFVLRSSAEPYLILDMGIKEVLNADNNYGFLVIVQSFVELLSAEEKGSILDLITRETNAHHQCIDDFQVYLKSKINERPKQVKQTKPRANTPTTDNTSISMDAEQTIENEDTDNTEIIVMDSE